MKNSDIEQKIRHAYDGITPDILDAIRSDCQEQKGKVLIMTTKSNTGFIKRFTGVAAAAALIAGGAFMWNSYTDRSVSSTISLDVNPSMEISVNHKEKVLAVTPRNDEAREVIGEMNFEGNSLDITLNALIGSMLRNGYLNELSNSILISVDGDNDTANALLRAKLSEEVNAILETEAFAGAVLSRTVTADDSLRAAAEQSGISPGKAQFVQEIVEQNAFYNFDDLANLSINELSLLSTAGSLELTNVESIGTSSDKAYIGETAARDIALTHAGVAESALRAYEIELDFDYGVMVYDIEFDADGMEYDYEIGAVDGAIVKAEKEADDDYRPATQQKPNESKPASTDDIGADKAKSIAFEHAGVNAADAFDVDVERDYEHGIPVYEIDFQVGPTEYDYDINAVDGSVIKHRTEQDDDYRAPVVTPTAPTTPSVTPSTPTPSTSPTEPTTPSVPSETAASGDIGLEQAKSIAFSHAGVNATDVRDLDTERETENGILVYEIDFEVGRMEYEYEIKASDGTVLRHHNEMDD